MPFCIDFCRKKGGEIFCLFFSDGTIGAWPLVTEKGSILNVYFKP